MFVCDYVLSNRDTVVVLFLVYLQPPALELPQEQQHNRHAINIGGDGGGAKYRNEIVVEPEGHGLEPSVSSLPSSQYMPTIPPTTASQQKQQSVRYIDSTGKYYSDQDIATFLQDLRQQLLSNLITLLSSALQPSVATASNAI